MTEKVIRELLPQAGPAARYHYMAIPLMPKEDPPSPEILATLATDAFGYLPELVARLRSAEISIEDVNGQRMLLLVFPKWADEKDDDDIIRNGEKDGV